jgi:hypothetical protein
MRYFKAILTNLIGENSPNLVTLFGQVCKNGVWQTSAAYKRIPQKGLDSIRHGLTDAPQKRALN